MSHPQTDEQYWQHRLTPEQFCVTRQQGTEAPFTGAYYDLKADGQYHCVCCGALLFNADHKYDSGSGWPSFWQPADSDAVETETDNSHGMQRTEVHCTQCDAHLGHVFPDGPDPTGLRYCINSVSLTFKEASTPLQP